MSCDLIPKPKKKKMFSLQDNNPIPRKYKKRVASGRWVYIGTLNTKEENEIIGIKRKFTGEIWYFEHRYIIKQKQEDE